MNHIRVTSVAACHGSASRARPRTTRLTQPWHRVGGFTLVELLVVIAVMLILIVMTVQAVDFAFTQERLKAGARQVQSALSGARDRAIFAKQIRGLRFFTDETDPRLVTGMVYIGVPDTYWNRGQIRLERIDDVAPFGQADPAAIDIDGDGINESPAVKIVRGDAGCGWYTLKERGLLGLFEDTNLNGVLDTTPVNEDQNGNGLLDIDPARIEIPAHSGIWYPVLTHRLTPVNQVFELATPYQDATTPDNEVIAFQGAGPSTYRLELQPRVLPEAQPILFPETVCIDLDGSLVPSSWRPAPGSPQNARYSSHMDILFSPRGVVTGSVAAMGLIQLYVAERKDVQKTIDLLARPPVNSNSAGPLVPGLNQFREDLNENGILDPGEDLNGNGLLDEASPIGQQAMISIFTLTGKVSSYPIDTTDSIINATGVAGSDGFADSPFRKCQGGVSNQ